MLASETIATATGCSLAAVGQNWPLIQSALERFDIRSDPVEIAAAATVAVETGRFAPVVERLADPRRQPALVEAQARYLPWLGRGFIQITWEQNYRLFSNLVGVDLIRQPELACDPTVAADILAAFFVHRGVDKAAEAQDWRKVRRLVNGGYNGWDRFDAIVRQLLEVIGE